MSRLFAVISSFCLRQRPCLQIPSQEIRELLPRRFIVRAFETHLTTADFRAQ